MKQCITGILFFVLSGFHLLPAQTVHILFVLPVHYGLNTNLYREKFIEFGFEMTVAGMEPVIPPCPWSTPLGAEPLPVDVLIDSISDISVYDAIVIAPMNWRINSAAAYQDLTGSPHFLGLIQDAVADSIPVMTSCAGTLVLAAANVINGIEVQGTPGPSNSFANQYTAAGAIYLGSNLPPVTDGPIVTTTRGQYYMKQNCEALMVAIAKYRP